MIAGTHVIYFWPHDDVLAGVPCFAMCIARPTSFPTISLNVYSPNGQLSIPDPVDQGGSLEQCLEIGNKWITFEQALAWGIDMEDGDQDLTEL